MAHNLHGIITGFTYLGDLPNVKLAEGYHLIALSSPEQDNAPEAPIPPFEALSKATTSVIRRLSMLGKCAYIETAYFGGIGTQTSAIWEDGAQIEGPMISYDGVEPTTESRHFTVVDGAVNHVLKHLGVHRSEDMDEFDSVGLGQYRSNRKVLQASGH
ncbi:hypothetical protein [Phaeodactylibacter sp.]|jgi:hypothetical protein|uniref:hypothetical protein n=1 Tax=Phaeodactylibacter sp. TaxID=1940289 RepID=UPI0025FE9B99|nr:hypothetical protein [Phaeodactylibacter sp.]MCI4650265.1 hypothetical protein [Phaeodactylibacter sp.]MCI5090208.1 hypothetical protein [Phaeodactylibacter sp.]